MRRLRWTLCFALFCGSAWAVQASEWQASVPVEAEGTIRAPDDIDDEAQQLKDQLEALKRESNERRALTVARGRAYVRLARAGLLPLSEGFDALAAHASRLERLRRALGRDLLRQRQLSARRLETARALQELDSMPPSERHAVDRARTAVLAAEERDQAFARAFQSDWNPTQRTAVYGARSSVASSAPGRGGFAAQRGRLPFPLAGRAEIQKLASPSGSGKALLMSSKGGSMVRAVYPGRVAFAADYPNLGNTVIIDHGGRYYTVNAHLQGISVEVGEELSLGQGIGTVGTYRDKPALLFEVRDAKGNTVDTPEWFGI
jgi:septal ring factor EnvC (AmiA/AmiB activator)